MRPSRSSLITIGLGLGVLGISLSRISGVGQTAFALFLAAVILVELFEESDRERAREPTPWSPLQACSQEECSAAGPSATSPSMQARARSPRAWAGWLSRSAVETSAGFTCW